MITFDIKPYREAKRSFEREYLTGILTIAGGHTCAAARLAGMSTPNFCKMLRKNGVSASEFREAPTKEK